MRTPITYYGGKQQLASTILQMIPAHRVYVEPYFGGGAVFFAKGKSYLEVINDINDNLVTFYEVCQDAALFPLLMDKIQHTLHSERSYKKAYALWKTPSGGGKLDIAWATWLVTNMSFSGSPSGGWKWDNGTAGSHSGVVMDNYRRDFSQAIHERLKHVQISCRDAMTVIDQRDREETFFFLDPPYPGCVQKHYSGFGFDDFEKLLERLTTLKGKFLLCNFQSELLTRYITDNGWNIAVKDMALRVANLGGHNSRKQEVMVYNYELEPMLF